VGPVNPGARPGAPVGDAAVVDLDRAVRDQLAGGPRDAQSLLAAAADAACPEAVLRDALIQLLLAEPRSALRHLAVLLERPGWERIGRTVVLLLSRHATASHAGAIIHLIRKSSLLDRVALFEALGRSASREDEHSLRFIRRFLRYGDQRSRIGAIRAAALSGNPSFEADLCYLLAKEAAEPVRLAALDALADLATVESVDTLRFVTETDRYAGARARAQEILDRLAARSR
jgi:hypothetical protein